MSSQMNIVRVCPCKNFGGRSFSKKSVASLVLLMFIILSCFNYTRAAVVSIASQEAVNGNGDGTLEKDLSNQLSQEAFQMSHPAAKRSARQYSFGLGKRGTLDDENELTKQAGLQDSLPNPTQQIILFPERLVEWVKYIHNLHAGEGGVNSFSVKRSKPQRFSFGLGKRSLEKVYESNEKEQMNDNSMVPEKRKVQRYQFGIGKRHWFDLTSNKRISNFEDFMKRRYSFGLGKRSA